MNALQLAALPSAPPRRRRVALLVDPRFPGGTGSAVAAEIRALAPRVALSIFDLGTAMFRGRAINSALAAALDELGLDLRPLPPVVRADTIVLHNPACLKFEATFAPRLSAARIVVVTHENFLRPDGAEGFDAGQCLALVAGRAAAGERVLAPVSATNRASIADWLSRRSGPGWSLAADDWPNICDEPFLPPTDRPRDRRGRHSRPGFEKFPPLRDLGVQFPPHAERCAILGADTLLLDRDAVPAHWELLPFGSVPARTFLAGIDFFVYFTHPRWRESFGRAIAEAIAAGKLVITDEATAAPFGPGVIVDDGRGVDRIIAAHLADPGRYAAAVRRAQSDLLRHRPEVVVGRLMDNLEPESADALL